MVDQGHRERYLEQLTASLRMRDFSAERIRETLAEVEAHLDASGEDPVEAFGEPSEFAEGLDNARERPIQEKRRHSATLAVIAFFSLLAVALALKGIGAGLAGEPARIMAGELLTFALALAICASLWPLFVAYAEGRRSRWPAVAVFVFGSLAVGAVGALVTGPVLLAVSAWVLLVAAAFAAVLVLSLARSDSL